MKRLIKYTLISLVAFLMVSCSEDSLSSTSMIKDPQVELNDFDKWILKRYTDVYNIDFKYRMEDIESDMNYNLVPSEYNKSIIMSNMVKYLCLEAYDQATGGTEFIRGYFPKILVLIGSPAYRNNGTMVLGTAEGGRKITLYNINLMNMNDIEQLNDWYFRTIHHEFAHILHQTKPYTTDFKEISAANYVTDSWKDKTDLQALQEGFISRYASSAVDEDFVEVFSFFITSTPEVWNGFITDAGSTGGPIIETKLSIVSSYLRESWEIEITELRDIITDRVDKLDEQDLTSLD
ncbi:zinc-binding metallopeptidase [Bacteroides propionicifaciens]|uniref:zinc-binding metallopeptidase n=1 Tax=Bacteroides propionicifaciens TaxID=392838 RepID=UPI0003A2D6D2|nr:putative zinc-binding metallopeptidase [Bacteroides propionicifaciens]